MKQLKFFNGRSWGGRGGHLYIAAYSVADAARLMGEARRIILKSSETGPVDKFDVGRNTREISDYYVDYWGLSMKGVTPERGVWMSKANGFGLEEKPVRII